MIRESTNRARLIKATGEPTDCGSMRRSPTTNWNCSMPWTTSWNESRVQPNRHDWRRLKWMVMGRWSPRRPVAMINFLMEPDNAFIAELTCQQIHTTATDIIQMTLIGWLIVAISKQFCWHTPMRRSNAFRRVCLCPICTLTFHSFISDTRVFLQNI